jgi:hypothetical protein
MMEGRPKYSVVIPRKIFILPVLTAIISVLFLYIPGAAATTVLGTADNFAVLGGSTVTNTGATVLTGDLGVSPGSAITGFPPGIVIGGTHAADAVAAQAQTDATAAKTALNIPSCGSTDAFADLGGNTLGPGVYCFSSSIGITGPLTLNGPGVYIFRIGSTLTTASASSVVLNGADPCNVYWVVGSSATLGTTTAFKGTIIALTSVTANTGATVDGRLIAQNGAVTLDTNTVTAPLTCQTLSLPPSTHGGAVGGAVGGAIMPIDMTSLFVAGAMTNAFWVLPTLGGIAGAAIALFKVKRKHE